MAEVKRFFHPPKLNIQFLEGLQRVKEKLPYPTDDVVVVYEKQGISHSFPSFATTQARN